MVGLAHPAPTNKALKAAFFTAVTPSLEEKGFRLRAAKDTFRRSHDGVVDMFQIVCLDGKPGIRIQPNVAVRVDQAEEIFHKTSGFNEKEQEDTPTIGGSIGNITGKGNRDFEFILESLSQIPDVTKAILNKFESFALPYFSRFDQIREIDSELNDRPTERTPNRGVPYLRYSSGLIVAKLNRRLNYQELVEYYTKRMSEIDKGFYHKRFEALVQLLAETN